MTLTLSTAFALLALAFFLLARLLEENRKLIAARRRSASITRRLKRHRDALSVCLEQASDEFQEMHERCESLEEELRVFRDEEARRDAWNRRVVLERLN